MTHTIEWPCARNLPQSSSLYHGDVDYCLMRVRIYSNLKRWDGFQVWLIRRDGDGVVIAQSTLNQVSLEQLDKDREALHEFVLKLKASENDGS